MMMPVYTSLNDWCSSLRIDLPYDDVPQLIHDDWKGFGNSLVQTGIFATNNAPSPNDYNKWEDWAFAVYYLLNNTQ